MDRVVSNNFFFVSDSEVCLKDGIKDREGRINNFFKFVGLFFFCINVGF